MSGAYTDDDLSNAELQHWFEEDPPDEDGRCDQCGQTSGCLLNGLCPMCYETGGGVLHRRVPNKDICREAEPSR